jgi:uncharacterized membrane protein
LVGAGGEGAGATEAASASAGTADATAAVRVMKSLETSWKPAYFAWAAMVVLVACSRFHNIGQKFFWVDEVSTSLRAAGETIQSVENQVARHPESYENLGEIRTIPKLTDAYTPVQTCVSLLSEAPNHAPGYFLALHSWARTFGMSPTSLRIPAAIISLLTIPLLFWLCLELCDCVIVGMLACTLFVISPFILIYSQQAREYSLWMALIIFSSAMLLHSIKRPTATNWVLYGLIISCMLYVHLLSGFVVLSHGLYLGTLTHEKRRSVIQKFLVAAVCAALLFTPWMLLLSRNLSHLPSDDGLSDPVKPILYMETSILNFARLILDQNQPSYQHLPYREPALILPMLAVIVLTFFSVTLFFAKPRLTRVRSVILLMMLSTSVPLALIDALFGGRRALIPRYLSPTWIALLIILAIVIRDCLSSTSIPSKIFVLVLGVVILSSALWSYKLYFSNDTWWTSRPPQLAAAARILKSEGSGGTLIAETPPSGESLIGLAWFLDASTRLRLVKENMILHSSEQLPVFLFHPSDSLIEAIEKRGNDSLVQRGEWLYEVGFKCGSSGSCR